jgi:hypothetical protein
MILMHLQIPFQLKEYLLDLMVHVDLWLLLLQLDLVGL